LLTLPEVEPLSQRAAPSQAAGHSSDKVLIIEDNDDARELLQTLVGLSGREVRAAHDGEEGVRLALEHAPDVILCDIGLPGLDGYGVVRQLKAVPGLRDCRMVAVTGYANPEDVARGEAAGFDAHLAKPPALATLEPLLRSKKHDRV
jgi:CheY-like chemotaxis protein